MGLRRLLDFIRLRTPLKDEKDAEFLLSRLAITRQLASNATVTGDGFHLSGNPTNQELTTTSSGFRNGILRVLVAAQLKVFR